jgi:DNA repair photolyase
MMPLLPYLQDSESNIRNLVKRASDSGAQYILASFGVTLRDRQRVYFYRELDKRFPGVSQQYQKDFGGDYFAPVRQYEQLKIVFKEACAEVGMARRLTSYAKPEASQLSLL